MKTFEWNIRTGITIFVAAVLTASVGVMGVWLLLSGQPGTGMMEGHISPTMMANDQHPAMMKTAIPAQMMGPMAARGAFGGYTGTIGLIMILVFVGMVTLLLYTLLHERPGQPQPAVCWNCERPVETDWAVCPYCGVELTETGQQLKLVEV